MLSAPPEVSRPAVRSQYLTRAIYDNVSGSLMEVAERLILYSLVFGLRPSRCLEIGFLRGGSAFVILSALWDLAATRYPNPPNGGEIGKDTRVEAVGRLVSVDFWNGGLQPFLSSVLSDAPYQNFSFVLGNSRDSSVIGKASTALGGSVDLCLIDADHSYEAVLADSLSVIPHMAHDSVILYHDCFNDQVDKAIEQVIATHNNLVDGGILSRFKSDYFPQGGVWGGLRLLRIR